MRIFNIHVRLLFVCYHPLLLLIFIQSNIDCLTYLRGYFWCLQILSRSLRQIEVHLQDIVWTESRIVVT